MNDEHYMQIALNLARTAAGQTSPNPPVGSVVVKDGEILGMGAHLRAGEPHAEVHALNMAGDNAEGATIFVTLEPCSHYGKTPPCADLIIERGIRRAVVAVTDPNEKVAGRGIEKLRKAGIEVELGVMQKDAEAVNAVFFHYTRTKTPYVTMKSAVSFDGKTATRTGDSKWITGEAARLDVHQYRHKHDAILVGAGTVIADNPSLTTRIPHGGKNPIRIVLDRKLRTPLDTKVLNDGQAETWIFTEAGEQDHAPYLEKEQVTVIQLDQLTVEHVLQELGKRNVMSLFVEGGATVNGSFLESRRINQLVTYMAPKLIGGKLSPTSIGGEGFASMAETLSLEITQVEMIGSDLKIVAEPGKDD
ncbi:bifunctional diaminohydroxyphosphoribosylaminopyrimidine deaminase/5-amino-6-(5-phosphoribosylamino)uracil reductase RibD [Virgibacillus kekensis]|uniref:Riboflavin biosynthesis protein RibD n=1 Tax=Virgibacillus kekensis TaxID=202261 RepID=A0ABV9DG47_9BACI